MKKIFLDSEKSEIIEMALSDHISFKQIEYQYGIKEKDVKKLMRENLKEKSYKAWRKRVKQFSSRRDFYK
ncbi:MAG: TIGR03643 family protein [Pelagibacterales bacterium]|nr:TIGR03643 family protein [Pelagibacterales bacterium]OUU63598.1 MAG: TIGR03643 family protein [Alphaproteobacteria bacterium TMED62]|tara:strand:- start:1378 stop:1587 length:210 start_codon:yes stop_codon:yes gene_type:complete